MERWLNKVAVVTGASGGIGSACVRALLDNGMIVVGLARRQAYMENELKSTLPEGQRERFHAIKCDLSLEDDIRSAFAWMDEHLGGVHVLINNAGIIQTSIQIVSENNSDALRSIIDVNIMGVALCSREAFQLMKRRNINGHIICINSIVSHRIMDVPGFNWNLYPSTKYAITAMTEVLRQEFLQHQTKIKITNLTLGCVNTNAVCNYSEWPMEFPVLQPNNIADAIIFCLQTPPNVQIRELSVEPLGQQF